MRYKLVQYKENIYANFWFVPLAMTLFAVGLVFLTLYLDHSSVLLTFKNYLNYLLSANTSKEVLSIIATSVITITSVTFSITVLTLSIASNQLGPRLLPNFMRQKPTQFVLGFFIGTFVYAILILQSMSIVNPYSSIPYISVAVGIVLGIMSFFLLIYFIHFVCHVIQIDNVLTFLVDDLTNCIERQLSDNKELPKDHSIHKIISNNNQTADSNLQGKANIVATDRFGYIQTIDYDKLLNIAKDESLQIQLHYGVGKFIFNGLPLMTIYSENTVSDNNKKACINALQIGARRSTVQDIEFAFEELSEIAIRALSPGINNPYTAIHCLDRMIQGFVVLSKKQIPSHVICDKAGSIRVMRQISSYQDIVRNTFNRFRQQAQFDLSVAIHILMMIGRILQLSLPEELYNALVQQAENTYKDISKKEMNAEDRKDLEYFYENIKNSA